LLGCGARAPHRIVGRRAPVALVAQVVGCQTVHFAGSVGSNPTLLLHFSEFPEGSIGKNDQRAIISSEKNDQNASEKNDQNAIISSEKNDQNTLRKNDLSANISRKIQHPVTGGLCLGIFSMDLLNGFCLGFLLDYVAGWLVLGIIFDGVVRWFVLGLFSMGLSDGLCWGYFRCVCMVVCVCGYVSMDWLLCFGVIYTDFLRRLKKNQWIIVTSCCYCVFRRTVCLWVWVCNGNGFVRRFIFFIMIACQA
jgi:hypothetical protein